MSKDAFMDYLANMPDEDYDTLARLAGDVNERTVRRPDLIIEPDGKPYIYRWHLVPRNKQGNVYLHLQVADDPERPLHDHPWDNQSVILAGGYDEIVQKSPPFSQTWSRKVRKGSVIQRKAEEAHRLLLPPEFKYTISLFSTGPVRRDWGFWITTHKGVPEFFSHERCIVETEDGHSIFKDPRSVANV